jgi:hypothetical protein
MSTMPYRDAGVFWSDGVPSRFQKVRAVDGGHLEELGSVTPGESRERPLTPAEQASDNAVSKSYYARLSDERLNQH